MMQKIVFFICLGEALSLLPCFVRRSDIHFALVRFHLSETIKMIYWRHFTLFSFSARFRFRFRFCIPLWRKNILFLLYFLLFWSFCNSNCLWHREIVLAFIAAFYIFACVTWRLLDSFFCFNVCSNLLWHIGCQSTQK